MRIVFMGTPAFAVPTLEQLTGSRHEVVAVVTGADKRVSRSRQVTPTPVKVFARSKNLPILTPADLDDRSFHAKLRTFQPDIGVVVAFRILPESLYSIPGLGCINLHPSLLPDLRGAAPINWALIRGYKKTGLTTFLIERQVDTGNVLLQEPADIFTEDDYGALSKRLAERGSELVLRTVDGMETGNLKPLPQSGKATRAPKIDRETCRINWTRSAGEIHNLVKGLSPAPAAFTNWDNLWLKIFRTRKVGMTVSGVPGRVKIVRGGEFLVDTGKGKIEILELQFPGRRRMSSAEFLRGRRIPEGTVLGK